MKPIFTILLSTLFISVSAAQSNSIFGYIVDQSYPASFTALIEGDNNHFYAAANDLSGGAPILIKADLNGNIVWQKRLHLGAFGDYPPITQLSYYNNYVYILAASPLSGTAFYYSVSKLDVNGNLLWSKKLTPLDDMVYHKPSIEFDPSGHIIVSSSTLSKVELFSLNDDGTTNWVRNCSTDSMEGKNPNFDITCCDNGDIMGCCKAGSDMSFYRISSSGALVWSKRILEIDQEYTQIKSIRQIGTNVFIATGYRVSGLIDTYAFYTLIDGSGNFISFNMVNGLAEIMNIFPLDNGNFLLEGITYDDYQFGLIEINPAGSIINSYRTMSSGVYPGSYEAIADINGHLFIGDGIYIQKMDNIGPTECFNYQSTTFTLTGEDPSSNPASDFFVQHPSTGTITDNASAYLDAGTLIIAHGCDLITGVEPNPENNIHVFPTLLSNNDLMFIEHEMIHEVEYQIMDINGKIVEQNVLNNSSVMINGLSTGIYVLQLTNNGNVVYHSKFVVN